MGNRLFRRNQAQAFGIRQEQHGLQPGRGRPRKAGTELLVEVVRLRIEERLTMREIACELGVSRMTLYRTLNGPRAVAPR